MALVVACLDVAHGAPSPRQSPDWLVFLWCLVRDQRREDPPRRASRNCTQVSTVFHIVAFACAVFVLTDRVEPPPEEKLLDYKEFDEKQPAAPKPRRKLATIVAIVATSCAFLWTVGAPPIIAVVVVNRDLNRRINHLEDEVDDLMEIKNDDNWEMPKWPTLGD